MKTFNNSEGCEIKVVGRRTKAPDALSPITSCCRNSVAWQKAMGGVFIPKGVFRFNSHEEADQWLWKMITRPKKR